MNVYCESYNPIFNTFIDNSFEPQVIADGMVWIEGLVWFDKQFCFNDIPNKKMYRWSESGGLSIAIEDADFANGNTIDINGAMVSCERVRRRIIRRDKAFKTVAVLAEVFENKRLNSPNDVVVKSDGTVWFTDPPYGINSDVEGFLADSEIGSNNVYRLDVDGSLHCVATDFDKPNGLAFSPDEKQLYIADSGVIKGASFPGIDYSLPHHVRVIDVENNVLSRNRILLEIDKGVPDGFRVDTEGYIWCSSADSLRCYLSLGELMGKLFLPETVSNCCFGGESGTDLFITCTSRVYRIKTTRQGAESLYRT